MRSARLSTAGATRVSGNWSRIPRPRSGIKRRKLTGTIVGLLSIAALAAGCGGAGAASGGNSSGLVLTSTQHEAKASTTPTTALANCGSNRDPFDPTGSPPPAGSPAIC